MPDALVQNNRLISLDAFRGITIAGMVLVNNPGTWDAVYSPLEHAEWNGLTPTDLVFPFFLFIVGIAIAISFSKRLSESNKRCLYLKILRRSVLLFLIGLVLNTFPFYNFAKGEWLDPNTMRIMGVLQRIAICYLITSLIFLHTNWKQQAVIAIGLLLIYWFLMTLVDVPTCLTTSANLKPCNLAAYIDRLMLTENHMWSQSKVYDPEGLLSTIPAIASTIAGVLTGTWLTGTPASLPATPQSGASVDYENAASLKEHRSQEPNSSLIPHLSSLNKVSALFALGIILTTLGWIWSFWFPINKSIWTSSYVVFTTGVALCFLGVCYWLIDIKGYKKWAKPFIVFGANAIALYVGSSLVESLIGSIVVSGPDGAPISVQDWIFKAIFLPIAEPINASLAYAVCTILIWLFLMWLLYRKRIFIRL